MSLNIVKINESNRECLEIYSEIKDNEDFLMKYIKSSFNEYS